MTNAKSVSIGQPPFPCQYRGGNVYQYITIVLMSLFTVQKLYIIYFEKIIPSCYIEDRKGKTREKASPEHHSINLL